jgi:hypothetical protein
MAGRQDKSGDRIGRFGVVDQWVSAIRQNGPAIAFLESAALSRLLAPSEDVLGRFGALSSRTGTAREKLGPPVRVCDWDN